MAPLPEASLVSSPLGASVLETAPRRRPVLHQMMHWIRRVHLYLGLFLFPWAVLYGFTGFLFNHPLVMSDQPLESFGREVWKGTSMETLPALDATADHVITALKQRHNIPAGDMQRVAHQPARYANDFAFATVKTSEGDIGLLFDVHGGGGTIRRTPAAKPTAPDESFPWAVGQASPPDQGGRLKGGGGEKSVDVADPLLLDHSLADRLKAAIPSLLQVRHLPAGEVTVTSVPDLTFVVESSGRPWKVRYNALKSTVWGQPFDETALPISWRRFLTRMHLTHGYPMSSPSIKWFWVIGADAIALVMVYWGGSGLLMWWQIKSTRKWGFAVLAVSAMTAILLAVGMHGVLSGG